MTEGLMALRGLVEKSPGLVSTSNRWGESSRIFSTRSAPPKVRGR
jgi:hypothetical protein